MKVSIRSKIIGCGSYLPGHVITNKDLEDVVETSDAWIKERTGIGERRVTLNEKTSGIAAIAAKNALDSAGVPAKDIDLIITGTVTPDMVFPSTSCLVQAELGLRPGIAAFDVGAACAGFVYALDIADKYIRSGSAKKALVIGVDIFSRLIDWKDRSTCVLFGDGAGAVILSSTNGKSGILSSHIHSDGRRWDMLYAPGGNLRNPFEGKRHHASPYLKMKGNEVFKFAVRTMDNAVREVMDFNGLKTGDIALLIPHQANIRIMDAIKERLNLTDEQVFSNIERYGNTSAASIPIALDEALREGRIKKGDIIVFVSFGGGFTWGASAVRW